MSVLETSRPTVVPVVPNSGTSHRDAVDWRGECQIYVVQSVLVRGGTHFLALRGRRARSKQVDAWTCRHGSSSIAANPIRGAALARASLK